MPSTQFACSARFSCLVLVCLLVSGAARAQAPSEKGYYARNNSFGLFGAYSNDSSHILLGAAEQRKLLEFGASYSRKLILSRYVNWQYDAELLPVALESDPLTQTVLTQTSPTKQTVVYPNGPPEIWCAPYTWTYNYISNGVTYAGSGSVTCRGRQWTIGEAFSPVGMRWNFLPRRRIQPFFEGHGGYMYSTHPIPVAQAGSFNFTFDFGMGVEWYRARTHSIRAEYRFHHISDHDTTNVNPGIDNSVFQVSYVFGR